MAGNQFGKLFSVTTFGESHGAAIGGVIDGCPAGIELNLSAIQHDLDRRKPGQSAIVTQRKEPDEVSIYSGVFEGKTTGTPIGFAIHNTNQNHTITAILRTVIDLHMRTMCMIRNTVFATIVGRKKSKRETASRVVAGAIAKQFLNPIRFHAFVSSVGDIHLDRPYNEMDFNEIEKNPVRCPDPEKAKEMEAYIRQIRKEGDTVRSLLVSLRMSCWPW